MLSQNIENYVVLLLVVFEMQRVPRTELSDSCRCGRVGLIFEGAGLEWTKISTRAVL